MARLRQQNMVSSRRVGLRVILGLVRTAELQHVAGIHQACGESSLIARSLILYALECIRDRQNRSALVVGLFHPKFSNRDRLHVRTIIINL
jgi:hypothetical protein